MRAGILTLALLFGVGCTPDEDTRISGFFDEVSCLEDRAAALTSDEALARSDWRACSGDRLDIGYSQSAHWIRMRGAPARAGGIVAFEWKNLSVLDLFVYENGVQREHHVAGIERERGRWPVARGDYPAFPITGGPGRTYLFRVQSTSGLRFPLRLHTPASFEEQFDRESTLIAFVFGVVVALVLIHLAFWIGLRDIVYILNAAGLVLFGLGLNFQFGNAFRLFLFDAPEWTGRLLMTLYGLTLFNTVWFFRRVTRLERALPRWDRFFRYAQMFMVIVSLVTLLDLPRQFLVWIMFLFVSITFWSWIGVTSWLIWRRHRVELVPFLVGWVIYSVAAGLYATFSLGLIPHTLFSPLIFLVILPFEIGLFSYGLYLRYRAIDEEKKQAVARLEAFNNPERYTTSRLGKLNLNDLLLRLNRALEDERVYRDEALTLSGLAERVGISGHQLSELLNARLGVNFRQLMLNYRLRDAERMLVEEPRLNVLNVGLEAGFNSKSAFNEAFKKKHGITPREFRKRGAGGPPANASIPPDDDE